MPVSFSVDIANGTVWQDGDWIKMPSDFGTNVMETSPTIKFTIDYPLRNPKAVEFTHEDGTPWTERQFVEAVCEAYKTVYAEEGENPGHIPGMLNRAQSHGKHGIWGHDITDLILEGAEKLPDGSWDLGVGS